MDGCAYSAVEEERSVVRTCVLTVSANGYHYENSMLVDSDWTSDDSKR